MPLYDYACFTCKRVFSETRSIAKRDEPGKCPHCGSWHSRKMPSAPNFRITGYTAKNGYSK